MTGTNTMKRNHSALATPWWSVRRKLSMNAQMTMKIHKTNRANMKMLQNTAEQRVVICQHHVLLG